MRSINLDIETYSDEILTGQKGVGVYKYVASDAFEVMLLGYHFDYEPTRVIDLAAGEKIPDEVTDAIFNKKIIKKAWNAQFERVCFQKHFGENITAEGWECTMVKSAMLGLPMGLGDAAKALQLPEEKDTAGKGLMKLFCSPVKGTKKNGYSTRVYSYEEPEKWEQFKTYCARDVDAETAIGKRIGFYTIPPKEQRLYVLDQKINDRGVRLDVPFFTAAIELDAIAKGHLTEEAIRLTSLDNPNSPAQIKRWLEESGGLEVENLKKESMADLKVQAKTDLVIKEMCGYSSSETVLKVLSLRAEMSKTSVKKYKAMERVVCLDGYLRGGLQFCGAGRTWRWAGRHVQPHNLSKNYIYNDDLDLARRLVLAKDYDMLQLLYGSVPDILSQLIRTAFVASDGRRFIPSDFSAIEARVLAFLAGEQWRLKVFATHGKIYEASASQMFKVAIETIVKGSPLRQKGKVSELALGYQGGPNALITMGALKEGIKEEELPKLVKMWRNANPRIVDYWQKVNNAAISALKGDPTDLGKGVGFYVSNSTLWCKLPSGRRLAYFNPELKPGKFGGDAVTYWGMNQEKKKWEKQDTYGGKLVENIVQAIARDLLAEGMLGLDAAGYDIALHVHDEAVPDVPYGFGSVEEVNSILSVVPDWFRGFPLKAEGYETQYYKKDD